MRLRLLLRVLPAAAAVASLLALLSGCGGSSGARSRPVTVGAYGVVPAATVTAPASPASGPACRTDARILADDAVGFLAHYGRSAAYPADLNYVIVREDLGRLRARGCDPALIGRALTMRLAAAQRREFVADLPATLADAVQAALDSV